MFCFGIISFTRKQIHVTTINLVCVSSGKETKDNPRNFSKTDSDLISQRENHLYGIPYVHMYAAIIISEVCTYIFSYKFKLLFQKLQSTYRKF